MVDQQSTNRRKMSSIVHPNGMTGSKGPLNGHTNGHASSTSQNPLTYPHSRVPFSPETFQNPPTEYRGAPFWGWVTKQDHDTTVAQIEMFEKMGMGGFHMHTRVGLDIPYMGDEFMGIVKGCVEKAREKGMYAYLYDEDRWPSGFAGGKVLEGHPELAHLHLLWTPWAYGEPLGYTKPNFPIANAAPVRSEQGHLLARYAISLSNGQLVSSRRLSDSDKPKQDERVWYAYVEPLASSGFFGYNTYTDLLSSEMTERFVELTHDVYKQHVGEDFGGVVPSIFTDEPQYCPMSNLDQAEGLQDVFLPWTSGILASFKKDKGGDLVDLLPEIIHDKVESTGRARYDFLDHVAELFTRNYIGVLAKWCRENDLVCTGHMNAEPTLFSQTGQNGEVMRTYRDMQLPGIDMLCDGREYNTAKQAVSVARQYGRSGVMSELYGVTGWDFTFEGHKGQGDWQAALGVTLRVPHLFWSTMKGEAKRDYPACIGYQSPWWEEYRYVEDHFARLNTALTRGRPVTRVAVVHPIESYWLCYGPKDRNFEEAEFREKAHADLTAWLLMGHIDFDFVSESLFPSQCDVSDIDKTLPVGSCRYEVVILPNLRTIRSTTLERLRAFAVAGGTVIIAGSTPTLVNALLSSDAGIDGSTPLPWSKASILGALDPFRDLDMTISETTLYRKKGYRADSLIYQLRADGDERYLLITNTDRHEASPVNVTLRGEWKVEVLDTMTGTTWDLRVTQGDGKTHFDYYFDGCESVLLRLRPGTPSVAARKQVIMRKQYMQSADVKLHSITLSEPNTLILDYCTYTWNDESLRGPEEILRVDQTMRERLGEPFFRKGAKIPQPWTMTPEMRKATGTIKLDFAFSSTIALQGAKLAIEASDEVKIALDGVAITAPKDGWWVDKDIHTVALPYLDAGEHTISLTYEYGPLTALERVYLLGDFGVELRGRTATLVPLELDRMEWGDITRQLLPFYTGNIIYHCSFETDGSTPLGVRVAHFASPAIAVDLDSSRQGMLMHEPFACELGKLAAGKHTLDLTCFGNRQNAFGPIHLVSGKTNWINADCFRSDFDWWSDEYVLGPVGILNTPKVLVPGQEKPKQVRRGLYSH